MLELLEDVDDPVTERAMVAERTFLQAFEGGCQLADRRPGHGGRGAHPSPGIGGSPLGHSGTSGRSGGMNQWSWGAVWPGS